MRLLKILLMCLTLTALPCYCVWAGEALVNSDVEVDVTGKDAADARAQAMIKAQTDALLALLNKLTTPGQAQSIVDGLNADKVAAMARGTEVLEEKMSSNRYRAHLMVTFDGDAISNLIGGGSGSSGADKSGGEAVPVGSFLILPAYEEGGTSTLWEDNNPWRDAWKSVGLEITSGDIVVPFGDSTDNAVIDIKNITATTYAALAPLTVRYGTSDIVVLQAKFTQSPDMVLTVVKRHLSRTGTEVNLLTYRADPQETKETLMIRAARDIAGTLQHKKTEELASVKTTHGGERNAVMVLASISTLTSWTDLRGKLSKLPMVDRLEILAIAPQQIDVLIHYRGSAESLANGITAQNVRLVQNPTYWVISRD